MATFKTTKNLLEDRDVYNRYYGDFRGVDFSSDHTQVADSRLAYCVNMYRDYQSGQGQALETIAGFRKRVILPVEAEVYGIFDYSYKDSDGNTVTDILIHAGTYLFKWANYPYSVGIECTDVLTVPAPDKDKAVTTEDEDGNTITTNVFTQTLENITSVISLVDSNNNDVPFEYENGVLTYVSSLLSQDENVTITYIEGIINTEDAIFDTMNERRSTAFIMNNKLYIIDGKNYLVYDGSSIESVLTNAYVPTTYINIIPSGTNADAGTEYEQRNMLSPQFKTTFITDGETTVFYLNENNLDQVDGVTIYDVEATLYSGDLPDIISYADYLDDEVEKTTCGLDDGHYYVPDAENGTVTLFAVIDGYCVAVPAPADAGYSTGTAGIEVLASKTYTSIAGTTYSDEVQELLSSGEAVTIETDGTENVATIITRCTIATIFDGRVFLTGNPDYPNHIFWCGRNSTGYVDPSYFGVLNCQQDGVGIVKNTGMITVSDTLMVLKGDTQQDAMVYFHTANSTGLDLIPKTYPSTQGLNGIGCLGACVNFLDDPIFISRLGVEAMGQLSVRLERAVEHRSSLIDAKLVNSNLSNAMVAEWNGYLLVLVDGNMYMADSRQKYVHDIGVTQYEWYYIEGIGVYKGQYLEYKYASSVPEELQGVTIPYTDGDGNEWDMPIVVADTVYNEETAETEDLTGEVVNEPDEEGSETGEVLEKAVDFEIDGMTYTSGVYYVVKPIYSTTNAGEITGYEALYCERKGNYTGGVFKKATTIRSLEENIFFGTENGVICSFNFDKREDDGSIEAKWYTFDDRILFSGAATKMDCCSIPHLTKNTIKKSTVIKTKSFRNSAAKVKVRTNKVAYKQVARISSSMFSFEDMDFQDFTFNTDEQSLFAVKEKEKKWVEKQYYIYSDEYMRPFSLYYISYRYQVVGRYKS